MSTAKTHIRTLRNPNYIGSWDLMVNEKETIELNVQVATVKKEMVQNGDKKEECRIVHLNGRKPLILNSTNEKALIKLFGTPFIEDWVGRWFTLYVKKVRAFGETVDALRIKDTLPVISSPAQPVTQTQPTQQQEPPKQKELFTVDDPKWEGVINGIASGTYSIDELKKVRTVSIDVEGKINQAVLNKKPPKEELL